jgi:hypothetical protein
MWIKIALAISTGLFVLALQSPAVAGCANYCELSAGASVAVTPALPCLMFDIEPDNCDCGLYVRIENACNSAVMAQGFTFQTCSSLDGSLENACATLEPDDVGSLHVRFDKNGGTGAKQSSVALLSDATSYVAKLHAQVRSFGGHGGCSVGPGMRTSWGILPALFAILCLTQLGRRKRGVRRTASQPA